LNISPIATATLACFGCSKNIKLTQINVPRYYYYYIRLMAFSRTTWVSRHQKGKPFWILLEQEMMVAVASGGPYANHMHLAPDR